MRAREREREREYNIYHVEKEGDSPWKWKCLSMAHAHTLGSEQSCRHPHTRGETFELQTIVVEREREEKNSLKHSFRRQSWVGMERQNESNQSFDFSLCVCVYWWNITQFDELSFFLRCHKEKSYRLMNKFRPSNIYVYVCVLVSIIFNSTTLLRAKNNIVKRKEMASRVCWKTLRWRSLEQKRILR